MPICYNCHKYITQSKRICDNGIKYICIKDDDLIWCNYVLELRTKFMKEKQEALKDKKFDKKFIIPKYKLKID